MVPGHRVPWILLVVVEETPLHHCKSDAKTFYNMGLLATVIRHPWIVPAHCIPQPWLSQAVLRKGKERERRRKKGLSP